MKHDTYATYPPLNTLKPITQDLFIVDGPIIRFGMPWPKMPFPTRMTLIRLACGDLFVHSPTCLVPELKAEIEKMGTVRWIIGPNRIHYWWIPEWRNAFPAAEIYLAPRIKEQAHRPMDFDYFTLCDDRGYPWDAEIATLPVAGSFMTEFEFFHYASRTLILTDLIQNFEPGKMNSFIMRWLTRLGGVQDPDGQMPRDMRLTFVGKREQLRAAIEKMLALDPERIMLAHGRWYEKNGTNELHRAFRWIFD